MRSAGRILQRLVGGTCGAGRRRQVDDGFRLPYRTLAAASEPEPEPEPEEPAGTTRSRWGTRPKTPCDGFSVPPAGHGHRGSAHEAGTAVDLRTLVGYGSQMRCPESSSSLLGNCVERNRKSYLFEGYTPAIATVGSKRWMESLGMQSRRFYSTNQGVDPRMHFELPPPTEHSINFMQPSQECPIRTAPFNVWTEGETTFSAAINKDKLNCEKKSRGMHNLQKVFSSLESALKVRYLLSPFSLRDRRSRGLHSYYEKIVDKVMYLTAYDFAHNYLCLPGRSRRPFLDFLCDQHAIVSPDWESTNTFVRHSLYDHGLRFPPNSRTLHKGESDASFANKKATISAIIWKDDQVVWCEVLQNIDCETSVEAEALAMCLLLKRAIEMSILSLEVCTDCDVVARVVQGDHVYDSDVGKEPLCKLYDLLRLMVGYFEELVCRWSPRENMVFVDSLMRNPNIFKDAFKDSHDPSGRSYTEKKISKSMINKWRLILNGDPIFSVKAKGSSQLKNTAMKNTQHPEDGLKTHSLCYHVVDRDGLEEKVNAAWQIIRALKPVEVLVRVKDVHSWIGMLKNVFGLRKIEDISEGENSWTVCLQLGDDEDQVADAEGGQVADEEEPVKELQVRRVKRLNIVLDVEVLETVRLDEDCMTIVLATKEEKNMLLQDLEELSAITYASFRSK